MGRSTDGEEAVKIYLASSWRNEQQPVVLAALRAAGHDVYDFKNPKPGDNGFGWKQIQDTPPPWSAELTREILEHRIANHGFDLDYSAMQWAEACVMLQPCGRSAALELGWAAGAGKMTFVILADGQEPELMLKLAESICTSVDEVIEKLDDMQNIRRKMQSFSSATHCHHAGCRHADAWHSNIGSRPCMYDNCPCQSLRS